VRALLTRAYERFDGKGLPRQQKRGVALDALGGCRRRRVGGVAMFLPLCRVVARRWSSTVSRVPLGGVRFPPWLRALRQSARESRKSILRRGRDAPLAAMLEGEPRPRLDRRRFGGGGAGPGRLRDCLRSTSTPRSLEQGRIARPPRRRRQLRHRNKEEIGEDGISSVEGLAGTDIGAELVRERLPSDSGTSPVRLDAGGSGQGVRAPPAGHRTA